MSRGKIRRPAGLSIIVLLAALAVTHAQAPPRKRLLALGDTHTGYTHDSIGHALAVIDHLGRQSGLYDTYIRTDSQWITKQPVPAPARNAKTLNDFDAVFLFISGEGNWTGQQKKDFVSFAAMRHFAPSFTKREEFTRSERSPTRATACACWRTSTRRAST